MKKYPSILSSLLVVAAIAMFALPGCTNDQNESNPIAPSSSFDKVIASGHAQLGYEARLQEIRGLVAEKNVSGTVEALDGLFSELSVSVSSGATSQAQANEVAGNAQNLAAEIDIDVHFGTDEKCGPTFNCVAAKQYCVSVTWTVDGTGGGRNCYNWAAAAQGN